METQLIKIISTKPLSNSFLEQEVVTSFAAAAAAVGSRRPSLYYIDVKLAAAANSPCRVYRPALAKICGFC